MGIIVAAREAGCAYAQLQEIVEDQIPEPPDEAVTKPENGAIAGGDSDAIQYLTCSSATQHASVDFAAGPPQHPALDFAFGCSAVF